VYRSPSSKPPKHPHGMVIDGSPAGSNNVVNPRVSVQPPVDGCQPLAVPTCFRTFRSLVDAREYPPRRISRSPDRELTPKTNNGKKARSASDLVLSGLSLGGPVAALSRRRRYSQGRCTSGGPGGEAEGPVKRVQSFFGVFVPVSQQPAGRLRWFLMQTATSLRGQGRGQEKQVHLPPP